MELGAKDDYERYNLRIFTRSKEVLATEELKSDRSTSKVK